MSIISISRGSYSKGKDIAERVAGALGYKCISREILLEASEQFNIPEIKMVGAIHDAPSVFDRFTYGKERYVAYARSVLLKYAQKDNIVYHGLGGHFLLEGIPHVLKVRITARFDDRVREEMKRENISAEEARSILKKDDDERRKWGLYLYGKDSTETSLYDMVLQIKIISVEDAADIIQNAVKRPCFQTTPRSQSILDDLFLAAQVEALLVQRFPSVKASVKNCVVTVSVQAPLDHDAEISACIKETAAKVPGMKDIKIIILPLHTVFR